MVVSTPSLVPESKIDLVLDLPVTQSTELGKTTENTWLEIKPPLPGKLRWKAQNIAEFLPDQAPAMGTTYTFSIPKNRKHLDATPVPAGKFATLASEEFRIVSTSSPNRWSSDYSASTAEWMIVFNDETDPAAAAAFVSFGSKSGQRVAARLERATAERAGYYATNNKPWAARWGNPPATETTPETPCPHILIATPVSPLPPGDGWQLSVLKGLPNTSATARITSDSQYEIGKIEPFRITGIKARISADEPRKIVASFNHAVTENLPADFLASCVLIEPRPENLQTIVDGREIQITGDLSKTDKYSVTLKPPFTSRGGLALQGPRTEAVTFEHLEPGLALPSDNQAQLANGKRSYQVQTVNLASIRVRIKKLAGADLIRAYQGYRHYTGAGPDGKSDHTRRARPMAPARRGNHPRQGNPARQRHRYLQGNHSSLGRTPAQGSPPIRPLPRHHRHPPCRTPSAEGRRNAQAIVQLTDIGLAWKFTAKEALVYAFSCDTGTPLPGVKVQLFGEDAAALDSATTDAAGLATVPRPEAARHLLASLGADAYLTAFDSTLATVGLWHFPVRYSWNTPAESTREAFLFTDRSLYRPGETVRLKGIVRTLHGNAIEAAKTGPARIVIIDPTEKEILSQAVTLSPNGSFDFTHTLAPSKTGTHAIRLEFPEELAKVRGQRDRSEDELGGTRADSRKRPLRNAAARRGIPPQRLRNHPEARQLPPSAPPPSPPTSAPNTIRASRSPQAA